MRSIFCVLLMFGWCLASCTKSPQNIKNEKLDVKVESKNIRGVQFLNLKEGDVVGRKVDLNFSVQGMAVAPAGEMKEGTGHFHVLIDTDLIAKNEMIPTDSKHLHFGQGQISATIELPPGDHKLTLLFADGAHRSYGVEWSHTVNIKVK